MKRFLAILTIGLAGPAPLVGLVGCSGSQQVPEEISEQEAQQYAEQSMEDLGMPREAVQGEMPEDPAALEQVSPGETGSNYPGADGEGNPYQ